MINQLALEKDIIDEIASKYEKTDGLNYLFHQSFEFYDGEEKNENVVIMIDLKEVAQDIVECLYTAKLDIYVRVAIEQDETFAIIQDEINNVLNVIQLLTKDYTNGDIGKVNFIKSSKDNNETFRVMQFEYELKLSEHIAEESSSSSN